MYSRLFHIYGPLWINSFGVMIALGVILFVYLTYTHSSRKSLINDSLYSGMILYALIGAFIGGRLFVIITEWDLFKDDLFQLFLPWVGGFGILGDILGVISALIVFFYVHHLPMLPLFDLLALYFPLLEAIARIGCFLAGCCHGIPVSGLWCSVTYTDPFSLAPLGIPLHPTQLYLSVVFFIGFLIIRYALWPSYSRYAGAIAALYLVMEGSFRFLIEYWRGDTVASHYYFSQAQLFALPFIIGGAVMFGFICKKRQ
jgi:phosphatidylglycerol---prolipoprotein diacylglyceryl transferase